MCPCMCHPSIHNSAHPIHTPRNAHSSICNSAHPVHAPGNVSTSIHVHFSLSAQAHASGLYNVLYYNAHVCGCTSIVCGCGLLVDYIDIVEYVVFVIHFINNLS